MCRFSSKAFTFASVGAMTAARVDQRLQRHKPLWLSEISAWNSRCARNPPAKGQEIARPDETRPTCDSSVQGTKADEPTRPDQGKGENSFARVRCYAVSFRCRLVRVEQPLRQLFNEPRYSFEARAWLARALSGPDRRACPRVPRPVHTRA